MDIALIKKDNKLEPVYQSDIETIKGLETGREYWFNLKNSRNLKHHRKLFAIIKLFIANTDGKYTTEQVLAWLKIKAGYYNVISVSVKGKKTPFSIPDSISFEKMGQKKFSEFYEHSVILMADALGITVYVLENEANDYL